MSASAPSTKPDPPGEHDDAAAHRVTSESVNANTHDVEDSDRACCRGFISLYAEAKLLAQARGGVVVHHVLEGS